MHHERTLAGLRNADRHLPCGGGVPAVKPLVTYVVFIAIITMVVLTFLAVLVGCSRHVERFDSQPRSWTKDYEPKEAR